VQVESHFREIGTGIACRNGMTEQRQTPAVELQTPASGTGPLLQRDYWAILNCRCRPSDVMREVKTHFTELHAEDIVTFTRANGRDAGLDVGDCLDIQIRMAGMARVQVVHQSLCSITLATLTGHPEAGRITFGAYRNTDGEVIFHIRSRARSSSIWTYCGFLVGGDPMQTESWTTFITNIAGTCGDGVSGIVNAETRTLTSDEWVDGDHTLAEPTFVAQAD
jgi:hypothetical protein